MSKNIRAVFLSAVQLKVIISEKDTCQSLIRKLSNDMTCLFDCFLFQEL